MTKGRAPISTETHVSAGGIVFRPLAEKGFEVPLVSVGQPPRWQLPKGLVDPGERPETTAIREVREEAGLQAEIVEKLKLVEYWYQATVAGRRVRIHKFVHFFLMKYLSGEVADHDHEVNEARWMEVGQAIETIAFKSERAVLEQAASYILRDV